MLAVLHLVLLGSRKNLIRSVRNMESLPEPWTHMIFDRAQFTPASP